jgi:hypothetical protein
MRRDPVPSGREKIDAIRVLVFGAHFSERKIVLILSENRALNTETFEPLAHFVIAQDL